nr:MAG TPA: Repressor protein CI [Bacteriophage sp.]
MSSQSPERFFPQKLQSMRERRRLSRQKLADLCGLSRNVIAQYERGKRFPSIGNLIVLADFFDTSIDDLVGRK